MSSADLADVTRIQHEETVAETTKQQVATRTSTQAVQSNNHCAVRHQYPGSLHPNQVIVDVKGEAEQYAQKDIVTGHTFPLADVNGGVVVPRDSTRQEQTSLVHRDERTGTFAMRDPHESHHHRSGPAPPLGEIESGDDSDCVVVVPSTERKVEPLKINLVRDREPLRTIIKLTPGTGSTATSEHFPQLSPTIREVPGSPKITIKPPKPPGGPPVDGALGGAGSSASSSSSSASSSSLAINVGDQQHYASNCIVSATHPAMATYSSSIPKLTIKPVINPADETGATSETVSTDQAVEQMHIIPKLLIKGSASALVDAGHSRDGAVEPHIVPKLTIRGVNNHNHHYHHHYQQQHHVHALPNQMDSHVAAPYANDTAMPSNDGSNVAGTGSPTPLVPKLTIKMDNHNHHHLHHHHTASLRVKDTTDGVVDVPGAGESGGPIPKLHIKTIQPDGGVVSIASSLSPGGGSGSCGAAASPVLTSSEGVKLTIKPLPEPPKLPKLTIKTTGLGTIAETSDTSLVSSTSSSFSPKPALPQLPPAGTTSSVVVGEHSSGDRMITLQHHHHLVMGASHLQPASPSDQHSNISSSSIPKLTIRPPKGPDGQAEHGANTSTGEYPTTVVVPRVTIKPILPPAKQSEDSSSSSETSINSLESSPVSSSSSSSVPVAATTTTTTSTAALRMTIKVPSSVPQHSVLQGYESNPQSGITTAPVTTRLNIKPILPPSPSVAGALLNAGGIAGDHSKVGEPVGGDSMAAAPSSIAESHHRPIVIPKVTIKTLLHPRSQETEILSTPKVTLKPIPRPPDESLAPHERTATSATVEMVSCLTNNSAHSPTAAPNHVEAMDSPRIILKINKGSSSTTTTSVEQTTEGTDGGGVPQLGPPSTMATATTTTVSSILANELKRPAPDGSSGSGSSTSSSSSSSVSCASSTSVSVSGTSSSAGSDPASPSSTGAGGDDPSDPAGSPEAKKSKLDLTKQQQQQIQGVLRQSMLQTVATQQQQQRPFTLQDVTTRHSTTGGNASSTNASHIVSDVIVIDDDSKSENETTKELELGPRTTTIDPLGGADGLRNLQQLPLLYPGLVVGMDVPSPVASKSRRTRGTPRGGGRQSKRGGAGRGAKQQSMSGGVPQLISMLQQDDREEGSSSDCMIVDDPGAKPTSAGNVALSSPSMVRGSLTLENLLRGGVSKSLVASSSGGGGVGNFYHLPSHGGMPVGGGEMDKNGTASNSSIGSVTSSIGGGAPIQTPVPAGAGGGRTPTPGVRMSTRRAAGQLLKEVLASKNQDRDSGVDEARTDGEGGLMAGGTPSKRPRGRPKKASVDMTMETNGGGSSNSVDGSSCPGGTVADVANSNMLLAMAMMGADEGGTSLLHPDGRGMLGAQSLMEGIMPLPVTPGRTPRARGRGRGGRGRGKLAHIDGGSNLFGITPVAFAGDDGNADPLLLGTPPNNTIVDPGADPTNNFHLLFNNVQRQPRGGRTRGVGGTTGRRARGSRTPRAGAGGRGAAKAAAAAAAAMASMQDFVIGSFADLASTEMAAKQQLMEQLQQLSSQPSPPPVTPKSRGGGRGRSARGLGTSGGTPGKRKGTRGGGSTRTARGRKGATNVMAGGVELLAGEDEMNACVPGGAVAAGQDNNALFMPPLAGGLDLNRPKLQVRELKTPKNAIKSNTPPSSATPSTGTTPSGTPGATTPAGMVGAAGGSLQVFEEDTRMSGDFNFTTPVRLMSSGDGCLQPNDESQSSYLSSTSVTQDTATSNNNQLGANASDGQNALMLLLPSGSADGKDVTSAGNSNSGSSRRNKGKMEVLDSHRAQFTVDLLAEYEWPPSTPGTKGADTFMIQEQIAEYLGVKSFKRKYPDLMRRPVDMEERNFILEKGLASEKMCDLGLTAVYAAEILDIMCTDYPEKYEEYTRFVHERRFRDASNRLRQQQEAITAVVATAPIDRAQMQRDKAVESASSWNCSFNKERRDSRRACMDLQTYVVQVPKRLQQPTTNTDVLPVAKQQPSNYPVALVPGQFSEYYTTYTPEELACYPINTMLLDPMELREIVSSERYRKLVAAEEARLLEASSSSSSSSSDSSDSDSDDSSSSDDSSDSCESSDNDEPAGRRSSITFGSGGCCSSTESENEAAEKIKSEFDRRRRPPEAVEVIEGDDRSTAANSSAAVTPCGPVRRSSRAMSAGPPVAPEMVADCKELTDSDDSDVPLIAHAVKRKNNLSKPSVVGAAVTVATGVAVIPSGGKRMQQEPVVRPVKRPPLNPFMCAVCLGPENKNRYSKPELFVRCNRCRRKAHPSCIGMSSVMYRRVQQYEWQCSECKLCMKCKRRPAELDSKMVYCDQCDRGYHLACKGLRNLPEGRWHCSLCTICGLCGAQTPEGHPNPQLSVQQRLQLAMVAEWTHEYGLNELTKIREHLRTLCVPCVRQRRQQQQPDEPQRDVLSSSSNGENIATLNNNNAEHGKSSVGLGVISMKPQPSRSMMSGTIIRQQ